MNPPATPDRRSCSGIVLLTIALCSGCAPVDLLLLTMGSAGYCPHCLTVEVGQYGVSAENVAVLKGYRGRTVKIEQFTEAEPRRTEIICRGAVRITTPDKRPFDDYIRKALIDELTAAELLSESAHVTLNG